MNRKPTAAKKRKVGDDRGGTHPPGAPGEVGEGSVKAFIVDVWRHRASHRTGTQSPP